MQFSLFFFIFSLLGPSIQFWIPVLRVEILLLNQRLQTFNIPSRAIPYFYALWSPYYGVKVGLASEDKLGSCVDCIEPDMWKDSQGPLHSFSKVKVYARTEKKSALGPWEWIWEFFLGHAECASCLHEVLAKLYAKKKYQERLSWCQESVGQSFQQDLLHPTIYIAMSGFGGP